MTEKDTTPEDTEAGKDARGPHNESNERLRLRRRGGIRPRASSEGEGGEVNPSGATGAHTTENVGEDAVVNSQDSAAALGEAPSDPGGAEDAPAEDTEAGKDARGPRNETDAIETHVVDPDADGPAEDTEADTDARGPRNEADAIDTHVDDPDADGPAEDTEAGKDARGPHDESGADDDEGADDQFQTDGDGTEADEVVEGGTDAVRLEDDESSDGDTGARNGEDDEGFVGFVAPMVGAAGGVLLLGGLIWWGATRDLSTGVIALLAVGAVLVGLYVAIHGRDLIAWGSTRSARRGSAATVQSIAIIGILGIVNWAAVRSEEHV